jgi:hypothetical protein
MEDFRGDSGGGEVAELSSSRTGVGGGGLSRGGGRGEVKGLQRRKIEIAYYH